jgi:hypothetical protein
VTLYPADQTAEDVELLAQAAARIAVNRREGAAYAFTLASLLVNSLFQDNFPEDPNGGSRHLRAV